MDAPALIETNSKTMRQLRRVMENTCWTHYVSLQCYNSHHCWLVTGLLSVLIIICGRKFSRFWKKINKKIKLPSQITGNQQGAKIRQLWHFQFLNADISVFSSSYKDRKHTNFKANLSALKLVSSTVGLYWRETSCMSSKTSWFFIGESLP